MGSEIRHIVLLDDEPSVVFALTLVLKALGFEVHDFTSPDAAISHATCGEEPADLFLCDLRMPDMNGHEVLSVVREKAPNLPFILISGHASQEDIDRAYSLGANGFLSKPFTPDQLIELIESI